VLEILTQNDPYVRHCCIALY